MQVIHDFISIIWEIQSVGSHLSVLLRILSIGKTKLSLQVKHFMFVLIHFVLTVYSRGKIFFQGFVFPMSCLGNFGASFAYEMKFVSYWMSWKFLKCTIWITLENIWIKNGFVSLVSCSAVDFEIFWIWAINIVSNIYTMITHPSLCAASFKIRVRIET